jgi:hypothetical protein
MAFWQAKHAPVFGAEVRRLNLLPERHLQYGQVIRTAATVVKMREVMSRSPECLDVGGVRACGGD